MPRLTSALVGLLALVAAVPSSAQVGSGRIAYGTNGHGMYTVAPDGSGLASLKATNARLPRWSPDGSKIAFIEYDGGAQLRVMNADGTDEHMVARDDNWLNIVLSRQPWSPDGSRLAWGPSYEGDIYTASAAGGDVRRITKDGGRKEPPVWSPTAPQLAYAGSVSGAAPSFQLFSVRDDGSAPVQITRGEGSAELPSWSPSGATIAFVRIVGPESSIYVVHPDGTELHRVVEFYGVSPAQPAWSPDGSRIAYTNAVNRGSGRYGGQEIFLVNADGSGERQLTELAPHYAFDWAPTWSPDGDQIAFIRGSPQGPLVTMNPDGTCEGALPATGAGESPSWQAVPGGPALGPKTCRAVAVEASSFVNPGTAAFVIDGAISNEGTEPLKNVLVTITAARNDLSLQATEGYDCTRRNAGFVCRIDRIERGESRQVAVLGMARRVGRDQFSKNIPLRAELQVTADGSLLPTGRETGSVYFTPRRCVTRDSGRGRIDGTPYRDRICGRRGADLIHPGGEKDVVDAGVGADVVFAQDGRRDSIRCGAGRDLVIADAKDWVARDCEWVNRR